jgi:hypothetical protein
MARRPKSFGERLGTAKDLVALYNQAQEVRAVLALLPEFADDESGIMDSLRDAARHLFQELLLWSKPETADDYGVIFDVTEAKWSERVNALRSAEAPLSAAHDWLLKLVAALDVEIASGYEDLVFNLREEVVQLINPQTVDQVRGFPHPLRGLGLVHLLDQYKARPGISQVRVREAEGWITTFLDRDAKEIAEVMDNPNIHTAADLLAWGRKQEYPASLSSGHPY